MIHELLERFRYRFELWRREQRDTGGTPQKRDTSHSDDPRNAAIITESTSRFVFRAAAVFFGGIAILAIFVYGLTASFWPSARHVADIIMLTLGAVWSLGIVLTALDIRIARRRHRDGSEKEI